jgi:hypothetical protein
MRRTMFLVVGAAAALYASALPPGTGAVDAGRRAAEAASARPSTAYAEARARIERHPELRAALRSGALEGYHDRLAAALEGSGLSADEFLAATVGGNAGPAGAPGRSPARW